VAAIATLLNMKPEDHTDQNLNKVLKEWRVSAALPPRFQEQVWHRIEEAETRDSAWVTFLREISAAFARPALAVSYVAVLLMVGLAVGYWQAQASNAQADQMLSSRYVQLIDPYQSTHH
jgi:hypothetical protein